MDIALERIHGIGVDSTVSFSAKLNGVHEAAVLAAIITLN